MQNPAGARGLGPGGVFVLGRERIYATFLPRASASSPTPGAPSVRAPTPEASGKIPSLDQGAARERRARRIAREERADEPRPCTPRASYPHHPMAAGKTLFTAAPKLRAVGDNFSTDSGNIQRGLALQTARRDLGKTCGQQKSSLSCRGRGLHSPRRANR